MDFRNLAPSDEAVAFSIPRLFIRRPVMTTLVMVGVLVFGHHRIHQAAGERPAATSTIPTIYVFASLPGASPETMAATVATPLEKQFSTIAGIDNMTSSSDLGSTRRHDPVHARPSTSTPRPRTSTPRSRRRWSTCRRTSCRRPSTPNPAAAPILFMALTSQGRAALGARRDRRDDDRPAAVDGRRRGQVGVWGSQKYAVRIALDPQLLGVARHRRRSGRERGQRPEREAADRRDVGANQAMTRAGHRQLLNARSSGRSSSRTTTARRCLCATWRT